MIPLDIAVPLGMAGSVLVALPKKAMRGIGFSSWIVSNIIWLQHGLGVDDIHVSAQFGFYLITASLGLYFAIRGLIKSGEVIQC